MKDGGDQFLSRDQAVIPSVPRGKQVEDIHNLFLDLKKIFSENASKWLLEDNIFKADVSLSFKCAQALGFSLDMGGMSLSFGAPLGDLFLRPTDLSFNGTDHILGVNLSFRNRSEFLPVNGIVKIEVYNEKGVLLGVSWVDVEVPPQSDFTRHLEVVVEDTSRFTGTGKFYTYVETLLFKLDRWFCHMVEENLERKFLRWLLPRVIKAILWSVFYSLVLRFLPSMISFPAEMIGGLQILI